MALKIRIKNLDDVRKELQELYESDGDGFMLSLDDWVAPRSESSCGTIQASRAKR